MENYYISAIWVLNMFFLLKSGQKHQKTIKNIGILALFDFPLTVIRVKLTCKHPHPVERMTVNHDVAGSSPAGGAKKAFEINVSEAFCLCARHAMQLGGGSPLQAWQ